MTDAEHGTQELATRGRAISERFLADVEKQFLAQMGSGVDFTALEKRLVQHMFLAVDQALTTSEARRKQGTEFNWKSIDRQKLALDTVHRVSLGLDALVPNHIWPIFYWNSKKEQYDVDLRVGYIGRDYVVRKFAMDPPLDITYELVYDSDHFKALPRSVSREVEGYEFEINNPFDRGDVIGGFGYMVYDDSRKNRLVLVTKRDFERAQKSARTNDFWNANPVEMRLKTVYHRVAAKLPLDPAKVNASVVATVLGDESPGGFDIETEVAQQANRQTIDVEASAPRPGNGHLKVDPEPEPEVEPEPAPEPEVQVEGQSRLGPDF
jgi:recombination protein RecT